MRKHRMILTIHFKKRGDRLQRPAKKVTVTGVQVCTGTTEALPRKPFFNKRS